MGDSVDYYDVQNMIRDARSEIRGELDDAIRGQVGQLRTDLHESLQDLRDGLAELRGELESLQRVLPQETIKQRTR